ncbi:hypothetical protein KFL_008400070 [Klebsormidium nitens]|uniref:Uncharacterized protein n=1 Tax=Klebsormidium nitens TaxID=105231 RepID=A0A1Y1IQI9_KLENI|nr:hypothetical protein KFL_008400070 [Klebsormidium nitens]|eukprot:GAQ91729.1 hypothetical protein KFL_008400070 [Klebsormidium nitens]
MASQGRPAAFYIHVPKLRGGAPALHVHCPDVQQPESTVQFLLKRVKTRVTLEPHEYGMPNGMVEVRFQDSPDPDEYESDFSLELLHLVLSPNGEPIKSGRTWPHLWAILSATPAADAVMPQLPVREEGTRAADMVQQTGPFPQQQAPMPQQTGPLPQQHGPMPQQQGPMPQQHGPMPQQQGPMPQQQGPMPQQQGPTPASPSKGPTAPANPGARVLPQEDMLQNLAPGAVFQAETSGRAQSTPLETPPDTTTHGLPLPTEPLQPVEAATPFPVGLQDTANVGGRNRDAEAMCGDQRGVERPPPTFHTSHDSREPQERHSSFRFWGSDREAGGLRNAAEEQIITPAQLDFGDEDEPSQIGEKGSREPGGGGGGNADGEAEAQRGAQDQGKEGAVEQGGRSIDGGDRREHLLEEVAHEVMKKRGRQLDFESSAAAAAGQQKGGNEMSGGPGAKRRKQTGEAEGYRSSQGREGGGNGGAVTDREAHEEASESEDGGESGGGALDTVSGARGGGTAGGKRGRGSAAGGRGRGTSTRGGSGTGARGRGGLTRGDATRGERGRGWSAGDSGRGKSSDQEEEAGRGPGSGFRGRGGRGPGMETRGRGMDSGGRGHGAARAAGESSANSGDAHGVLFQDWLTELVSVREAARNDKRVGKVGGAGFNIERKGGPKSKEELMRERLGLMEK